MNTKLINTVLALLAIVLLVVLVKLLVAPAFTQVGKVAEAKQQDSMEQRAQEAIMNDPGFLEFISMIYGYKEYGTLSIILEPTEAFTPDSEVLNAEVRYHTTGFAAGGTLKVSLTNRDGKITLDNVVHELGSDTVYDLNDYR